MSMTASSVPMILPGIQVNKYIPNALTILRMLLVPLFIWLLFFSAADSAAAWALSIFILASFTDYLDGFLARRWQVISDFGKIMDPLADKLLVLSALLGLTLLPPFRLHPAIFILIFMREFIISVLRETAKKKGLVIAAGIWGKLKTVMQMLGIIAALAAPVFFSPLPAYTVSGIRLWFWLVVLITLFSGINYLKILFVLGSKNA